MDWATRIMEALGYPGIVLVVLAENLFPPIPSEAVLPFAGFMTTRSPLTLFGVVAAATAGSVLGSFALYFAGAAFGRERVHRFIARYQRYLTVGPEHLRHAEEWFARHGARAVFLCRMVPILRSVISIPAGLVRMNAVSFTAYTVIGSFIWNAALAGAGAALGASWPVVSEWVGYYQTLIIGAGATVIVLLVVRRLRSR
ncbi:MAG: DedA family protein [Firmicutes bacterium]|nr:DedA family protein [Bacillota bacterium]